MRNIRYALQLIQEFEQQLRNRLRHDSVMWGRWRLTDHLLWTSLNHRVEGLERYRTDESILP
ncbi:hypothetical protein CA601_15310 [Paraburkholderia hospita]|nr:hypothetical protein CA601_15310 [Paraburkholderia hospita]OUL96503.1 hypothetical protein CA603_05160 [Paraburkholderia hospita]